MKKGYTLVELLAVIAVLAIILVIAVPKMTNYVTERKKSLFITSAKSIARQLEYNNMDTRVNSASLADLGLEVSASDYDLENSSVVAMGGKIYINLVGKGKYEGMYLCGVTLSTKDEVRSEACEEIDLPELVINLNGGTSSQRFENNYETGTNISLIEPTREGYRFNEWQLISGDSELSGNSLTIGEEDTEIKAIWEGAEQSLIVELDGGTLTPSLENTYTTGETVTLGAPSKVGATFNRWQVMSGNSIISGNTLTIGTRSTTIRAIYTQCSGGTYNDGTSNSCMTCPGGTYSNAGAGSCTTCPSGTYSNAGAVSCTNCRAGTYSSAGQASCTSCEEGTYSGVRAGVCSMCPSGTYSGEGSSGCTSCNEGSGEGSETCSIVCGAGAYLEAGAKSCTSCPAGKYCRGGTYAYDRDNDQGITGDCSAGTYSEGGVSSCLPCTGGYTSEAGASSCTITCSNSTGVASWSETTTCTAATCNAGYRLDGKNCTQCAAGTYSEGGLSSCLPCTGGYTSETGASSCTVACTNSTGVASWSTTATCTAATCNANYYKNGVNCTACAGGKTTSAGNSSTSCSNCSNSANVATWNGAGCTIKTCNSGYSLSSNKCVVTPYWTIASTQYTNAYYCGQGCPSYCSSNFSTSSYSCGYSGSDDSVCWCKSSVAYNSNGWSYLKDYTNAYYCYSDCRSSCKSKGAKNVFSCTTNKSTKPTKPSQYSGVACWCNY